MNFDSFLKNNLHYIREKLNLDILKQKDDQFSILQSLFGVNDLEIITYIFDFAKEHYPALFLQKCYGIIFLVDLIISNTDLNTIKYVFDFTKNNYPFLFLEKDDYGRTILQFLGWNKCSKTFKYVLDFVKNHFPQLFFEKNWLGDAIPYFNISNNDVCITGKHIKYFEFIEQNFPEILTNETEFYFPSDNNIVLPLTFQIQN